MRTIKDVEVGEKFIHRLKGDGIIISRTKRTLTAKFKNVTTKITYNKTDSYFSFQDF